jgi:hypothetical protein
MNGVLAGSATDFQDQAAHRKDPLQDREDRCRISGNRRREHALVIAHAALFKRDRRTTTTLVGHCRETPFGSAMVCSFLPAIGILTAFVPDLRPT